MTAPVVLAEPVILTTRERITGWLAIATARILLTATRGRPLALCRILRHLQRGTRPGDPRQAARARAIVETLSLRCASPHGCLPRSVAVCVLCRWRGHRVTWCVGVCSLPPSLHAWNEASGHPVGEPFHPRDLYTPIITT